MAQEISKLNSRLSDLAILLVIPEFRELFDWGNLACLGQTLYVVWLGPSNPKQPTLRGSLFQAKLDQSCTLKPRNREEYFLKSPKEKGGCHYYTLLLSMLSQFCSNLVEISKLVRSLIAICSIPLLPYNTHSTLSPTLLTETPIPPVLQ